MDVVGLHVRFKVLFRYGFNILRLLFIYLFFALVELFINSVEFPNKSMCKKSFVFYDDCFFQKDKLLQTGNVKFSSLSVFVWL